MLLGQEVTGVTGGFSADLLEGRVAVVTGGAGTIGRASCLTLARSGADIVCCDIHEDRVGETVDLVRGLGRHATGVVADLTSEAGMAELVSAATSQFPSIHILINNLGEHLRAGGSFENSTEDQWQALYEINYLQTLRACHAFIPMMKDQEWGRIVNFSSVEGMRGAPTVAAYAGFKHAIDGFTKSIAVDLARFDVLVNAIAIDKIRSFQTDFYEYPDEYAKLVEFWTPAGRFGEGEDIANLVVFLASALNRWIVGQSIVADGGTLAAGGWFRTLERWTNQPLLVQFFEDPSVNATRPGRLR